MSSVVLEKKPLPKSASYTQEMQDRFGYNEPVGFVSGETHSDKAGTLYLEESDNAGTSWTQTVTIAASAGVTTPLPWTKLTKRWFRFRYANGAAGQGSFVLVQQVEGLDFVLPNSSGALTTIAQLSGSSGDKLAVNPDGSINVGGITVDSLTATTVGIDQTTPGTTNKVVAELSGSKMELYGASLDDRPDATTVPIGATFTIVDASQEFRSWMSNGTNWLEV